MFYGLLDLPWWGMALTFLCFTQLTIMAVTLYLHRCMAHRSLDMHPLLSHVFRFWLWATTGMQTKAWTAIHRKHHAKCETMEDPHSPQIFGIKTVMSKGAELYRKEALNQETLDKYGKGTPNDWLERHVYARASLGFSLLLVFNVSMFGVPGLGMWALQMAWIPFFAAGVINGAGHFWGYRNFESADASTNLIPWGFFVGGEELHNNHHTYPTSAKFSIKPWEFDIGWMYLTIFKKMKLVHIKRVAPKVVPEPGKSLDMDTVAQLIQNRFEVMTRFTKFVTKPAFENTKPTVARSEWKLLKSLKPILTKDWARVDASVRESLSGFFSHYQNLNQVFEFRMKLQEIWDKTYASPKELLESLQAWCAEAEKSGVRALEEFSSYLQSYKLTN